MAQGQNQEHIPAAFRGAVDAHDLGSQQTVCADAVRSQREKDGEAVSSVVNIIVVLWSGDHRPEMRAYLRNRQRCDIGQGLESQWSSKLRQKK